MEWLLSGIIILFFIWLIINSFSYNKIYAKVYWNDKNITIYGPFENESKLEDWTNEMYLKNDEKIIKIKGFYHKKIDNSNIIE
jgi:hypothetical protein